MCGFAGEFILADQPGRADLEQAARLAQRLGHRGPDESGSFLSADGRCAMGFARLSVIDLAGSHQPMTSPDGQVTLAFNGEIYNFRTLRETLASTGYAFRTAGDTEVLLAMYLRHGIGMLNRLEGMFAAAIYDGKTQELLLVRDRLGVKPLWFAQSDRRVFFASEAKGLPGLPGIDRTVDLESLGFYLTLGYVPAPRSIWAGIRKLEPGSYLRFSGGSARPEPVRWWRPAWQIRAIRPAEGIQQVRDTLAQALASRLVADVPLGALLSGGVDSSIVAGLMCLATGDPRAVKTFSVGFEEDQFDERPFARRVAGHLGTTHREFVVRPDAASLLDTLVAQFDEPFADSSALPSYLLCQAVRSEVTVALCGDGGDEAFAGYDRHRAMHLAQRAGPVKTLLLEAAGLVADTFAPQDEKSRLRRFARFAGALDAPPALRYLQYRQLFSAIELADLLTDELAEQLDADAPRDWFAELYEQADCASEVQAAQRHDVVTYLPDDLLVKADIASMAHGLELRSPMLDHRVIDLGLSLPDEQKVDHRRGKRILREAFGHLLPAEVFDRPKAGFGVPIDSWLRGPLLEPVRQTLLDQSFVDVGWFRRSAMERLIDEHAAGKRDHRHRLWALLWLGRWHAMQ